MANEVMSQDEIDKFLVSVSENGDNADKPSYEEKKGRQPLHTSRRKIYTYDFKQPTVFIKEVRGNFHIYLMNFVL